MSKEVDESGQSYGSKSITGGRSRDLFERRFSMIFTITLFSVFTLLFFAAIATPVSAGEDYDYVAWDNDYEDRGNTHIYAYYWNFIIPANTTITQCKSVMHSDEAALFLVQVNK